MTIPFHAKKPSPHNSLPKRIRGVGGGRYQKEHCLAGEFSRFFADQIFQKVGGIKIILAPSFAHFLPTLLSLQVAKFFQGKPKILPPIRFQKKMALLLTLIWANRHASHDFKQKHIRKNCQNLILTSEILDQSFSFFSLCVSSPLSPATLGTGLSACRPSHFPGLSLLK